MKPKLLLIIFIFLTSFLIYFNILILKTSAALTNETIIHETFDGATPGASCGGTFAPGVTCFYSGSLDWEGLASVSCLNSPNSTSTNCWDGGEADYGSGERGELIWCNNTHLGVQTYVVFDEANNGLDSDEWMNISYNKTGQPSYTNLYGWGNKETAQTWYHIDLNVTNEVSGASSVCFKIHITSAGGGPADDGWVEDWKVIRSIVAVDTSPPQWSNPDVNVTNPQRGEPVNISVIWNELDSGLDYAWLETNETGSWDNKTDYDSPRDISSNTLTVNFTWTNDTGEPRVIGWRIYANNTDGYENGTNNPSGVYEGNFTMWGWSNITWTSPDDGSYSAGTIVNLTCFVNDTNTTGSGPISGYDVYFYNETAGASSYLGVNFTNSSGYAVYYWDTTGLPTGDYYPKCNITNNSTLYYNASEYYQDNTTIGITGVTVNYRNVSQSISLSFSAPRSADVTRMETLSITHTASNMRTQGLFIFLPQSLSVNSAIIKLKSLLRTLIQSLDLVEIFDRLKIARKNFSQILNLSDISKVIYSGIRTTTQSLQINDAITKFRTLPKLLSQALNISTAIERLMIMIKTMSQSLQMNALTKRTQSLLRAITQSLSLLTKITTQVITGVTRRFIDLSINISAISERLTSGFRTFSQSLGINETATKILSFLRALSQSIGITDAIKSIILIFKNLNQSLNVNAVVSKIYSGFRTITQAINLTDIIAKLKVVQKILSQAIDTTEISKRIISVSKNLSQVLDVNGIITRLLTVPKILTQSVNVNFLIRRVYSSFRALTQSFALNTVTERIHTFFKTLPQSMVIQTAVEKLRNVPRAIAQSLQINTLTKPLQNILRTITQSLSLLTKITTQVIIALVRRFIGLSINISAISKRLTSGFRTFSQSLGINEIITRLRSIPKAIAQALGISDVISKLRALPKVITQSIGITDMIEKISSLSRAIAQFLNMNDVIERVKAVPRILSETLNINDVIKRLYSSIKILSQTLSMNTIATQLRTIFKELSQSLTTNAVITRLGAILRQTSEYFTTTAVVGRFSLIKKLMSQSFSVSALSERVVDIFRSLTQTLNANILTGRIVSATRTLSQTLGLANVATRLTSVFRILTQSISIASQITARTFKIYERIVSVALSISQMVSRISFIFRSISQSLNIGNITTRLSSFFRALSQTVNLTSIVDRFRLIARIISQSLSLVNIITRLGSITRVLSQSFSTTGLVTRVNSMSRTISQSLLVTTSAIGRRVAQLYEKMVSIPIMVSDIIRRLFSTSKTVTGSFAISDVMTRLTEISRAISQSLNISGFITSMGSRVYERIVSVYFAITHFVQKIRTVPRAVSQATNLSVITSRVASVFRNIFAPIWLRFKLLFPAWMYFTQPSCESAGYYWCNNACQSESCYVPTTTVPSGGGPPITGGPIVVAKRLNFTIHKDFIKVLLKPDGTEKKLIDISNTGDTDLTMTANLKNLEDFLVFPGGVSEYTFDLSMGETKSIQLNFFVSEEQEPGVFPGKVVVTGDGIEKIITVVVEVESIEPVFDIDVEIPQKYKEVLPGEEVLMQLIIYNVKRTGRVDVDVEYGLKDLGDNIIVSEHETLAVEMQVSIARSLDVPFDIKPGTYVLYATVKYDGTVGTGSDIFRAVTEKGIGVQTVVILSLTTVVLVLTIVVVTLTLYKRNYRIYVYKKNLEVMRGIKKRMRKRG